MLNREELEMYKNGEYVYRMDEVVSDIEAKLKVVGFLDRSEAYIIADILAQALFSQDKNTRNEMRGWLKFDIWPLIEEYQMLEVIRKACWGHKTFKEKWNDGIREFMERKEFVERAVEDFRQNIYHKEVR